MVLPNVYFFARAARDPSYLDQPDEKVLADFAAFLGGPPELLIPAWSCLRRGLSELPEDLPERLRRVELTGRAAAFLPGGASRYLDILARQADSRLRLLKACRSAPKNEAETVAAVVAGASALVDWWKTHRYVQGADGDEPFRWRFVNRGQYSLLRKWCAEHVSDPRRTAESAAEELSRRGILPLQIARQRMGELLRETTAK